MPGLVPGIHVFLYFRQDVDGRDKPGHDAERNDFRLSWEACLSLGARRDTFIRAAHHRSVILRWPAKPALEG